MFGHPVWVVGCYSRGTSCRNRQNLVKERLFRSDVSPCSCLTIAKFDEFPKYLAFFNYLQMSFNTSSGRPIARAFRRVDLPGVGQGGSSHCQGVRNMQLHPNFEGESIKKSISISQAHVKLWPQNTEEGGSVFKRVPCVERGLDNFRSIRWERQEVFCLCFQLIGAINGQKPKSHSTIYLG